jgi:hypothetical protein
MREIILTEEQARIIAESQEIVVIRNSQGEEITTIDPINIKALLNHRKRGRSKEPGIPGKHVHAHLDALEKEWDRSGGFDETYMLAFLKQLREKDAS